MKLKMLVILVAISFHLTSVAAPLLPRIHHESGFWIVNDMGQVVILRGVNMVSRTKQSPEEVGFDTHSVDFLKERGFNVVRLGVNWSSVEPKPGEYNTAYLDSIKRTIRLLAKSGIYSLVDFHSGLYGEAFQGDGAPAWATVKGGTSAPDLGFPLNYFGGPIYNCRTDIDVALDAFWRNDTISGMGLQDHYAKMLNYVVRYLKDEGSNILGYDLMNEPAMGSDWHQAFKGFYPPNFYKGARDFDEKTLTRFYRKIIPAVQKADAETIVWYEPNMLHGLGAPSYLGKLGFKNIGMTFHNYDKRSDYVKPIEDSIEYSTRTGHPLFVGEFGATLDVPKIQKTQDENDMAMLSATYWTYFNNVQYKFPTTGRVTDQLPVDPRRQGVVYDLTKPLKAPNVNMSVANALTRVFPQIVSGTPLEFNYNPQSNSFFMVYLPKLPGGGKTMIPTEIVVPKAKYPKGYSATVTGGQAVSAKNSPILQIVADGVEQVVVTVKEDH